MHDPKGIKDFKPQEIAKRELLDGAESGFASDWEWDGR
jgi:hypothetical protein